jgi:hypothetical protein
MFMYVCLYYILHNINFKCIIKNYESFLRGKVSFDPEVWHGEYPPELAAQVQRRSSRAEMPRKWRWLERGVYSVLCFENGCRYGAPLYSIT